jgi:hypothetical protein
MSLIYKIEKLVYRKNRSIPVFREYDRRRGFDAWSRDCQASSTRTPRSAERDVLGRVGFAHVKLMSEKQAVDIREAAFANEAGVEDRKNVAYSQTIKTSDKTFLKSVVEKLITPEVDDVLYNFFGSEYCPYWYHFSRALPNKEPKRAFLWHCDKGPSMHAKMLFYMTGVEETGGNTYLLDRQTTLQFDKAGYVFGSQSDRQNSLDELAKQNSITFNPVSFNMRPGEAILFLPQKVLHRGLLPTKQPRYIMQVTFVPSKMHWKQALWQDNELSAEDLAKDYAWPKDARTLQGSLVPAT